MAKREYVHEFTVIGVNCKAYRQRADGGVDVGVVHRVAGEFVTILWSEPGATVRDRVSKRYTRGEIDSLDIIIEGR